MKITKRFKRRLGLLVISILVLAGVLVTALAIRNEFKSQRMVALRESGFTAYASGDWVKTMRDLGFVISKDRTDLEALILVASARTKVPQDGNGHLLTALRYFAEAAERSRTAGNQPYLIRALEGQIEVEAAVGQISRLQDSCLELVAIDPDNELAISLLREVSSLRGNYLPEDAELLVRGDRSNLEWLTSLRALKDDSALRWSLELEEILEESSSDARMRILDSLRRGNATEVQRRQFGAVRETPTDLAANWATEDGRDMDRILLAIQQIQDDDPVASEATLDTVAESSLSDPRMIFAALEIRQRLVTSERNSLAIERLTDRAARLANEIPEVGVTIAVRQWQTGRSLEALGLLKRLIDNQELQEKPDALAEAALLAIALQQDVPEGVAAMLEKASVDSANLSSNRSNLDAVLSILPISRKQDLEFEDLASIVGVQSVGQESALVRCILGDLLAKAGYSSLARQEWRLTLGQNESVPVRIRLIRILRQEGQFIDAFREALVLLRISRNTRSIAEFCEAWIALEKIGTTSTEVDPRFDSWESPLELVELLMDSVENSELMIAEFTPMLVDAAILEDRPDLAENAIDKALTVDLRWNQLRRITRSMVEAGIDRVEPIREYARGLAASTGDLFESAVVGSMLYRAEGRFAEALVASRAALDQLEDSDRRDALGAEMLASAISSDMGLSSVSGELLGVGFSEAIATAVLTAAINGGDREIARDAIARITSADDAGAESVASLLAKAKFTLAFESTNKDAVRRAIVETDRLIDQKVGGREAEILMVQLLGIESFVPEQKIELLAKLVKEQPGKLGLHVQYVEALQESGRFADCETILDDLRKRIAFTSEPYQNRIAACLEAQGRTQEASDCYCETFERFQSANNGLRCLLSLRKIGAKSEARSLVMRLASLEVRNKQIDVEIAAGLFADGDRAAAQRFVDNSPFFDSKADRALAMARLDAAFEFWPELALTLADNLEALKESPDARLLEALLLLSQEGDIDFERAGECIDAAVALSGGSAGVLRRACIMALEHEPLRARLPSLLDRFEEVNYWQSRLLRTRFIIEASERPDRPSEEAVLEVIALVEENPRVPLGWILAVQVLRSAYLEDLRRGEIGAAIQRSAELRRLVSESGRWAGSNPQLIMERLLALGVLGDFEQAWSLLQSTSGLAFLESRDGSNSMTLASIALELGRYREMEEFLSGFSPLPGQEARLRSMFTTALLRQGRVREAWDRFAALSSDREIPEWPIAFVRLLDSKNAEEVVSGVRLAMKASDSQALALAAIVALADCHRENPSTEIRSEIDGLIVGRSDWTEYERWELRRIELDLEGIENGLERGIAYLRLLDEIGDEKIEKIRVFPSLSLEEQREMAVFGDLVIRALNNSVAYSAKYLLGSDSGPVERQQLIERCQSNLEILGDVLPDAPEIMDTRAEFMIAAGDFLRAVEASESAVANAPGVARFRITYARSLFKAGRAADARRQLVLAIHLASRMGVSGRADLLDAETLLRDG